MDARNTTFQQFIYGAKQFLIPVFQRDYKWQEDNWQKLWDDILGAGNAGHFAGSIVHAPDTAFSSIPTYLVIDGQQRLATLTVLCAALRDHIQAEGLQGNGAGPTAGQIEEYCLKNNLEAGDLKYKLVLRRTDNETLRSVVDGHPLDNDNEAEMSLIDEAYRHFRDLLRESGANPGTVYRGIMGLRLVEMTLDRNIDNPQTIFESMNSTGVDLSQGDLVRNFLLMGLGEEEQTRFYEQYWRKIESLFHNHDSALDSFIRDYIALKQGDTKQARGNQIYDEFKRFRISRYAPTELEDQLREMLRFAGYYARFRGFDHDSPPAISQALVNVRNHGDTAAVLIMRLFDCYDQDALKRDEFVAALEATESYLMRRAVARSQTRSYWDNFAGLAKQVEDSAALDSLLFAYTRQRGTYSFPPDSDFRRSLEEGELYRARVCHHLLSRLENHGSKEPSPTDSYSIEHIMPQNKDLRPEWQLMLGENWQEIQEHWLHRLGNLTLTAYNSRYSDRPFEEKKTIRGGFKVSAVRLNAYVREQQAWTEETISERGKILAGRALAIWKYPQPAQAYVEERRAKRVQERAERTDVSKVPMTGKARNLFDPLHKEISNLDDGIQVVQERNSVCYYTPGADFFLELLPQKYNIRLLLDTDLSEIEAPAWLARDGNSWKYIPNSSFNHSYGVVVDMWQLDWADNVMQIIRQAYNLASN